MKPLLNLVIYMAICLHGIAAGFTSKQQAFLQKTFVAFSNASAYLASNAEQYTIKGFETYLGRKLSPIEKKVFRKYQQHPQIRTDEEEAAKQSNKRLGMWSMILGFAAIVTMFIPPIAVVCLPLYIAALITGIISVSRAGNYNNEKGSGFGSGLTGLIIGGVGILMLAAAVLLIFLLGI
jgi:hypothetical protein